jgi:hypothetical protein
MKKVEPKKFGGKIKKAEGGKIEPFAGKETPAEEKAEMKEMTQVMGDRAKARMDRKRGGKACG